MTRNCDASEIHLIFKAEYNFPLLYSSYCIAIMTDINMTTQSEVNRNLVGKNLFCLRL